MVILSGLTKSTEHPSISCTIYYVLHTIKYVLVTKSTELPSISCNSYDILRAIKLLTQSTEHPSRSWGPPS